MRTESNGEGLGRCDSAKGPNWVTRPPQIPAGGRIPMETGMRADDDQGRRRGGGQAGSRGLVPSGTWRPRIHESEHSDGEARAGWVDAAARILLAGVDSLNFSFDVEVSEETYLALMGEQLQARLAQRARNAAYCSRWLEARVLQSGAKGYGVLIETAGRTIKAERGNPTPPPLYIEPTAL